MHKRNTLAIVIIGGLIVALLIWLRDTPSSSASLSSGQTPGLDETVVSFRVQFSKQDREPRDWSGTLAITGGEVIALRNWHPRPGDQIQGTTRWTLATRNGPNFQRRAWEEEPSIEPVKYLLIPGLIVDVRATATTEVKFRTPQGEFTVEPRRLKPGQPVSLLSGQVEVDRVVSAQKLSDDAYENDFADLLAGPDGEMWLAWVTYRNKGNEVIVRRFDGKSWERSQTVTTAPADVFLAKLGRDSKGRVWAIWSAQENGNWDLYGRRLDGAAWSRIERLTDDAQPDVFHRLAADSRGNLWLVWQGFRNGRSDIFARRYDGERWSAAEQLSTSPANDWEPAIAAGGGGRVYVAWDTYDQGNYDIVMRSFNGAAWEPVVPVANSLKFEAHASLACDRQNRLWAAWNESGVQWGKDSGFLVKKEATRLYQWRGMAIAVYDGKSWQEPVADINQSLPEELRDYNDFPTLVADGTGRIRVFFRHRTLRIRDTHNNTPAHRAAWELFTTSYEGSGWSHPIAVPFSQGRTDVRSGFAADSRGQVCAAWATDNRDFEEFLFKHSDIYAGRLTGEQAAPSPPTLKSRVTAGLKIFPVHPNEQADLQRIREYKIESGGKTYRIYRGDTHRHTEFSMDGNNEGTLFQTYRYALDAADLDFLAVSEHNGAGGPDIEYINWLLQQACDVFMLPQRFTPIYGYERSVSFPNGHRNILFATRGTPTLPIPPEEAKGEAGAQKLFEYLKRFKGISIPHTSATNMGTDWRDNDPAVEPLVEIYQGDRVSAEYEGAPKAAHRGNPASAPGGFRPLGYVWNAWAKGYKLGIQAASDHLSNHISYACTIAADSSRESLLDAMRLRHSYGATDNIILDYRLETGGKEYLQGDIVQTRQPFLLRVKVIGTAPIRQIEVIRSQQFIHTRQPMKTEDAFTFSDNQPLTGESYYYIRVIQVDDQMAWSSPIWIQR
jgi:hypothetical protein